MHFGHLDAADAARRALELDEVWFVPSHDPPHRPLDPVASPFHRFAMASLAVPDAEAYRACDLELRRAGSSYTIDTLQELHAQGWAPSQLFFIIGVDAFAEVATWRAYPDVLERRTSPWSRAPGRPRRGGAAPRVLGSHRHGRDHERNRDRNRDLPGRGHARGTCRRRSIRQRLRDGESISDLVPAQVERHIMAHGL